MDEIQEAEAFSKELDALLSGVAAATPSKDLEFAAKMSRLDLSAESGVRRSLKAGLLDGDTASLWSLPWAWLTAHPKSVGLAAAAACVAIVLVPLSERNASYPPTRASGGSGLIGSNGSGFKGVARGSGSGSGGALDKLKAHAAQAGADFNRSGSASSQLDGAANKDSKTPGESLEFLRQKEVGTTYDARDKWNEVISAGKLAASEAVKRSGLPVPKAALSGGGLRGLGAVSGGSGDSRQTEVLSNAKADTESKWNEAIQASRAASPAKAKRALRRASPKFGALQQRLAQPEYNTAAYTQIVENEYQKVVEHPLSTFSIDVDGASYANIRRFLSQNQLPPKDAVRLEEMINYFHYDYPEPEGSQPFSITTEQAACPWEPQHQLVRIGLKGKSVAKADLPPNNLVFLIDSSGSMMVPDRLPLLKQAFRLLVEQLRPQDRVAIVAYAGQAGLVLPSTPGDQKTRILDAIDALEAGGSTAGGAGIELAYQVAAESFMKKGNNRVILATDGDFNVGTTSDGELVRLIEQKRESGVFLTALGVGDDNYKDAKMKALADHGNGNYYYLDDLLEAKRVFVQQMGGTLLTIAKDVKLQIEFNPARVHAYRLIGYESRLLKAEDFNNDKKDAGELGAGHTVTALYEVIPDDGRAFVPDVDPLKYQKTSPRDVSPEDAASREILTVKFRYKEPTGQTSKLITQSLLDQDRSWSQASEDLRFAAAAAGFGMVLRDSQFKGDLTYAQVRAMAAGARGSDEGGYRAEMVRLVEKAELLDRGGR
jgi:Ca-activated chloride channel family protein